MVCALRNCVYAFGIGIFVCAQGSAITSFAKDGGKEDKSLETASVTSSIRSGFQWKEHQKLSWEDFRGPVNAISDESAAATHCGMGFKIDNNSQGGKPEIIVYNTFYTGKSWVKPDAKLASILVHEQGHFDLCEIYTRRLRMLMNNFDFNVADVKGSLMAIFTQVNDEYEQRQQAYEKETAHGTNERQQSKWLGMIQDELSTQSPIAARY